MITELLFALPVLGMYIFDLVDYLMEVKEW